MGWRAGWRRPHPTLPRSVHTLTSQSLPARPHEGFHLQAPSEGLLQVLDSCLPDEDLYLRMIYSIHKLIPEEDGNHVLPRLWIGPTHQLLKVLCEVGQRLP